MSSEDDTEEPQTWWTFFPFQGIDITNKRHDLHKPIFGDVTLISLRHIEQVIASLKLKLKGDKTFDAQRLPGLIRNVEQIAEREAVKTFLAVRRKGIIDTHIEDEDPPIVFIAKERAYEFSALLAVVLLTQSKYSATCGLAEQIQRQPENLTMFNLDEGGFWVRTTGAYVLSPFSNEIDEPMSRVQLKRILFNDHFRVLTDILATKKSRLPKSFQRAIKQATLRLADAIHSASPSAQLLGAVTTLEILFTLEEGEKYDINRQRVIAFLGSEAAQHYDIRGIFQTRHLYVHQGREVGREVESEMIPYQAIMLALSCLLHYVLAVVTFSDKADFITYLDFIYKAEQRSAAWSVAERQAFNRLLKHKRTPIDLPFRTLH